MRDVSFTKPNIVEELNCEVCGQKMKVTRDCYGPTSYCAAISGSQTKHDFFWCPDREKDWHIQAKSLKEEASKTPSKKVEQMFLEEAEEILQTKVATK